MPWPHWPLCWHGAVADWPNAAPSANHCWQPPLALRALQVLPQPPSLLLAHRDTGSWCWFWLCSLALLVWQTVWSENQDKDEWSQQRGRGSIYISIYPVVWLTVGASLQILQPASSTPHSSQLSVVRYSIQGQSDQELANMPCHIQLSRNADAMTRVKTNSKCALTYLRIHNNRVIFIWWCMGDRGRQLCFQQLFGGPQPGLHLIHFPYQGL